MKITVDPDSCEANGICEQISSEMFRLHDDDTLEILIDTPTTDELIAKARQAFQRCPKAALSIED